MKFAIISHVLPPSWSGQAMILFKLLKDVNPSDYILISREDYMTDNIQNFPINCREILLFTKIIP